MKIQSLAVIFIIIILPITMILNVYIGNQVKTIQLQTSYDSKLNNATYDAIKAFQLNTTNSSTSDLANSKLRDIEASVNNFFNSLADQFNMPGYNKDILTSYVPALVYTMYDGYYIYSPYTNTLSSKDYNDKSTYKNGERISGLKPYIYYSCRYKKGNDDFIITYSLDNYITIQGEIAGKPVFDFGYLIDNCSGNGKDNAQYRGISIKPEILKEYGPDEKEYVYTQVNGVKYYKDDTTGEWFSILNEKKYKQNNFKTENNSAVKYYSEAAEFKNRILNTYHLGDLKTSNAVDGKGNQLYQKQNWGDYKIFDFDGDIAIEEPNSNFNQHRLAIIRYSIEKNLSIAIANYNNYAGGITANFQMPKLKEDEWEKIINNVSIISFLQGLNIGGKVYNGYSIITNTKNKEVVNDDAIYITTTDGKYHKPIDKDLVNSTNIKKGVFNVDFEKRSIMSDSKSTKYFFPNRELACYNCIVNQTNINATEDIYDYMESIKDKNRDLVTAYFTALGRERYGMYKTNNNSAKIIGEFLNK